MHFFHPKENFVIPLNNVWLIKLLQTNSKYDKNKNSMLQIISNFNAFLNFDLRIVVIVIIIESIKNQK